MGLHQNSLLVVEDEAIISMMIEDMATDFGWSVQESAASEPAALDQLAQSTPDLVLLDLHLGGGSGLSVAAQCEARKIPVIIMTGADPSDIPAEYARVPVLQKPFSMDELRRALGLVEYRKSASRAA